MEGLAKRTNSSAFTTTRVRGAVPSFPNATKKIKTSCLIIGGGISGISSAYELSKAHQDDYILLDLEDHLGGNSHSGKNKDKVYPWGAHYLPIPGDDAIYTKELLKDLGVITGEDPSGN